LHDGRSIFQLSISMEFHDSRDPVTLLSHSGLKFQFWNCVWLMN